MVIENMTWCASKTAALALALSFGMAAQPSLAWSGTAGDASTAVSGTAVAVPPSTATGSAQPPANVGSSAGAASPAVAPLNIYSEIGSDKLSSAVRDALPRVYVPNHGSNTVSVIDPASHKVIETIRVGRGPEHIIPAWDLKTLWVANNADQTLHGSLTPVDPSTGKAGKQVAVNDPYNMYFMPDGSAAIVVAEAFHRLELRDPQSMALKSTIETPTCKGINHADYSADYSFMVFTCEFSGNLLKIDVKNAKVLDEIKLSKPMSMPQDVRRSADGTTFVVTDMMSDGVYVIDAGTFRETGFLKTGKGAHGLTTSRDGTRVYVSNRGSNRMPDKPRGEGSVSVIDFASKQVVAQWPIPGGGSPDMGNVTADGKELWLSGRFDNQVYAIDTATGAVTKINVGIEPHGLTVWPQPGRFSLGHTGNMR